MNKGWELKKLGELYSFKNGINFDKTQKIDKGILTVDVLNMYNDGTQVDLSQLYRVNKEVSSEYILKDGDILIVRSSVKKEGVAWATYFRETDEPITFCGFIIRGRPLEKVNPEYVVHFLRSSGAREELIKTATQSTITNINQQNLSQLIVPVPPLSEQQRIVFMLDSAFASIAQAKANAERNRANGSKLFESLLNDVFENPEKNWEICSLDKYIKFIDYRGRTPPKTQSGMRLITAKNVKLGFLQREPEEFVDPSIYDSWMVRGFPKKGDVLFTTEAPLANVAQLDTDEKVLFAQRIIILQPQEKINQTFLKYMLLSKPIRKRIFSKGTGATVQGIKARWLKTVEIYFPPLAEQQSIVARLDALASETKRLEEVYQAKLNSLDELRKSISQNAFEGVS